jgi:tetratricopeptide (TPR) repeat protein
LSNAELSKAYLYLDEASRGFFDDYSVMADINAKKGYVRYLQRRYSEALNLLSKAISLNKRIKIAYVLKIKIYFERKKYKNVIYTANQAIAKISENVIFYYYLAESYFYLQNYIKSEEAYQKCVESGQNQRFLHFAKLRIKHIKKLIAAENEAGSTMLKKYALKTIITFDEAAKIINSLIDLKAVLSSKVITYSSSDAYSLLRIAKVFNRPDFLREKYVSRGDLSYISVKLLEFLKNISLGLENKYTSNPGIPDLNDGYYAFKQVLYVIEQNIMELKDNGSFGVLSNAGGLECIKLIKEIKLRAN